MFTIPKSQLDAFRHVNPALRWGQALHQHLKLERLRQPEDQLFCDQLYNEPDDSKAQAMVAARVDLQN